MLMTEEQAKETWCPHYRSAHDVSGEGGGNEGAVCIGSQCAMWRWAENLKCRFIIPHSQNERAYSDRLVEGRDDPPPRPDYVPESYTFNYCDGDPAGWVEPETEAQARRPGYCGLAGRP